MGLNESADVNLAGHFLCHTTRDLAIFLTPSLSNIGFNYSNLKNLLSSLSSFYGRLTKISIEFALKTNENTDPSVGLRPPPLHHLHPYSSSSRQYAFLSNSISSSSARELEKRRIFFFQPESRTLSCPSHCGCW